MSDVVTVNKQHMRLWVEALESGEYQQGTGRLAKMIRTDTDSSEWQVKYCCLGVACEVAIANGVPLSVQRYGHGEEGFLTYDGQGDVLPQRVRAWLGLDSGVPLFAGPTTYRSPGDADDPSMEVFYEDVDAVTANDVFEWDFNNIAAHLRDFYGLGDKHGLTSATPTTAEETK